LVKEEPCKTVKGFLTRQPYFSVSQRFKFNLHEIVYLHQGYGDGAKAILDNWSQSPKLSDGSAEA